jgi:hypothetical protein
MLLCVWFSCIFWHKMEGKTFIFSLSQQGQASTYSDADSSIILYLKKWPGRMWSKEIRFQKYLSLLLTFDHQAHFILQTRCVFYFPSSTVLGFLYGIFWIYEFESCELHLFGNSFTTVLQWQYEKPPFKSIGISLELGGGRWRHWSPPVYEDLKTFTMLISQDIEELFV